MKYRRVYDGGGCYFFTVNLENRWQTLLTDHIDALRAAFRKVKQKHPFDIDAIVVLPDHLHTIWTLPDGDSNYSVRWKLIKEQFTRAIPAGEIISSSRRKKQERGLWQRRFWEHRIRDEIDLNNHIEYIYHNPVKHGYCQHPQHWPYSSYHRFQQRTP